MDVFFELRFRLAGESAHGEVLDTIKGIERVDVLLDHTRELGWLERQSLRVPEWDCRLVVWVLDDAQFDARDRRADERDPYRTVDFDGPKREVPEKLVDLMERLDARYALVRRGWLRFETRLYEQRLRDGLEAELVSISSAGVETNLVSRASVLRGRLTGYIPTIRSLELCLRRSGMVDADRITVGYD